MRNGCGVPISGDTSLDGTDINLGARQERDSAAEIDGEAAFYAAEDHAGDALVLLVGFFEFDPDFFPAGFFAGEDGFAIAAFDFFDEDFDGVADLTSGSSPGLENSWTAMRPSDLRPTSTMTKSSVRPTIVPVTTLPSNLVEPPSDSARSFAKSFDSVLSCSFAAVLAMVIYFLSW
jgi:hypothetical protein